MLDEVLHDGEAGDLAFKVSVLDTGLDGVQGGGDSDRRDSADNGGDEILTPSGLGKVGDAKGILFSHCRRAEELCRKLAVTVGMDDTRRTAKLPGALRAIVQPQPR